MNRRTFLSAMSAVPVSLALPVQPPEKPSRTALTEHQRAVVHISQDNMRRWHYNTSAIGQPKGYDIDKLSDSRFPEQFHKMVTRHIAGVGVSLAPCNLAFIKNMYDPNRNYYDGSTGNDMFTKMRQDLKTYSSQRTLDDQPYKLDVPGPILELSKIAYTVVSTPIKNETELAATIDCHSIAVLRCNAQKDGNWDKLGVVKNQLVIAHPDNEDKVRRITGLDPFVSTEVPRGYAILSYKHDEYHAPLYFMPYVPYCFWNNGMIGSRYGMVMPLAYWHWTSVLWQHRCHSSSVKDPAKDVWVVEV